MALIIETCPKCGHDLINEIICTYPPIPRKSCPSCGWSWEGELEEVVRVPFGGCNASNGATVTTLNLNGNANNKTTVENLNDYLKVRTSFDYLNDDNLMVSFVNNFEKSPCDKCSNNVKNGGSGHCNCILATPKVTC